MISKLIVVNPTW